MVRFNAFKAHHDINAHGLALKSKRHLIEFLRAKGKIFITTEKDIEPEFKPFLLKTLTLKIHSILYYATMLVGDSQTMTSESAVLGTPALKCNSFAGRLSVPNELEKKYQLCFAYSPEQFDRLLGKAKELLLMPHLKEKFQKRRQQMLADKIDVTAFMLWLVENWPLSRHKVKNSPEFWAQFK